ncbi:MAG: hypothetical protein K6G68_00670 [Oscillospiraceae bacterium]|nr:hypothetical protein [Oscillospiraceae bacterium]
MRKAVINMDHPFQDLFEGLEQIIQSEADGFANILSTLVSFDVVSQCSTAIGVFTAAGSALLTLFFCMEAFTYCANIDFNGGIEGALRIAMKLVVSQLIVQNTGKTVGAISGLFKSVSLTSYTEAFQGISNSFKTAATASTFDPGILDLNYLCMSFIMLLLVALLFVMFSLIVLSMLGVIFETGILVAISPVALSTLVNSQARSTGIAFIKNFAAVSMQWGVLSVIFMAYNQISTNLTLDFASGLSGDGLLIHIMQFATPLLCVIMLAVSVSRAGEITRRALGG